MPPDEQAAEVAELFKSAAEIDPGDRGAFLDEQCGSNARLRAELESLFRAHDRAGHFMERSAADVVARDLVREGAFGAGQIVGGYEIVSLIGKGGMGEVYLARDRRLNRNVALKLVRRGMDTEEIVRRFHHEQRLLAGLNHPNIAQLYDAGLTEDGIPFFVMEYIDGTRIDEYCQAKALTLRERLELFSKVCAAVHHAHQHLVVHRDIKPSNIVVTPEGEPKLLDFGIAKALDAATQTLLDQTITLQNVMTPEYASPEHVRGEPITTASDVYSLGVLLYELLTGVKPYKIETHRPAEIARVVAEQEPSRPSTAAAKVGENSKLEIRNSKFLRGDLDNIVLMAMRKEPERRYSSAAQLSGDIRRHLEGLPVTAQKDTLAYRSSKFIRRNRLAVAAAAIVTVALIVATVVSLAQKRTADRRFNDVRQMANSLLFEVEAEIQKGPTKAREKLVRHALTYLDSLAREVKSDPTLQVEVAAGYLKVGDIQGKPYRPNLGDTSGALASYTKAQQILEPLASALGANQEAKRYLSLAFQSMGRLQVRNGEWARAVESQHKAIALAETLTKTAPHNNEYLSLLADNYLQLGVALYQAGRASTAAEFAEAIDHFGKALSIHLALVEKEPDKAEYRYATGVDYEFIGLAYYFLGERTGDLDDYRRALENSQKELEINEALVASDPTNEAYRRIRGDAYGEVAQAQLKLGAWAEALENFRKKLAIFESIEASDPTNIEARRDVAGARHEVAGALGAGGETNAAWEQEAKARQVLEELRKAEPENSEIHFNLINTCNHLGDLSKNMGRYNAAKEAYENALRLLHEWINKGSTDNFARRLMAITHGNLAALHETIAQTSPSEAKLNWSAAHDYYQRSLSLWQQLPAEKLSKTDRVHIAKAHDQVAECELTLSRL